MVNLLIERLKVLNKPHVIFWHRSWRFEGIVIALDDTYLELWDNERNYRKFFKIDEINDLEIKE